MSLDTEKIHRLKGKGFDQLHKTHPDKWKEMVHKAHDYAQTCVGAGEKVRIGDVVAVVQNAIKIDPEFEEFTKTKGLPQKFWVSWYAEFIVDSVYPQPDLKKDGHNGQKHAHHQPA
jgi:hypothetical protein